MPKDEKTNTAGADALYLQRRAMKRDRANEENKALVESVVAAIVPVVAEAVKTAVQEAVKAALAAQDPKAGGADKAKA